MARIKFEIEFEDKSWKPIKHEGYATDKAAWRIYRLIIPKKIDYPPQKDDTKAI